MNRNFQEAADAIAAATCIVSVEKLPDGGYGEIRIVTGNKAYVESMEMPESRVELRRREFVPNSLYTEDVNPEQSQPSVRDVPPATYGQPTKSSPQSSQSQSSKLTEKHYHQTNEIYFFPEEIVD